jgi:hypothetical protein
VNFLSHEFSWVDLQLHEILLISVSQVVKVTGMSHWHLAVIDRFLDTCSAQALLL